MFIPNQRSKNIKKNKLMWLGVLLKAILGIILSLVIIISLFFAWIQFGDNRQKAVDFFDKLTAYGLIYMLEEKAPEELTLNDKFVLFHSYYLNLNKENLIKLFELVPVFEQEVGQLESKMRIAIAGITGSLLRADNQYGLEFEIYEKFLKDRNPVFYRLFRAESYKAQDDFELAEKEHEEATVFVSKDPALLEQWEVMRVKFFERKQL